LASCARFWADPARLLKAAVVVLLLAGLDFQCFFNLAATFEDGPYSYLC
jgi:hypothetical protein